MTYVPRKLSLVLADHRLPKNRELVFELKYAELD